MALDDFSEENVEDRRRCREQDEEYGDEDQGLSETSPVFRYGPSAGRQWFVGDFHEDARRGLRSLCPTTRLVNMTNDQDVARNHQGEWNEIVHE